MKRHSNLYEKIISYDNLLQAHYEARKGKAHYKEVDKVNKNTEKYIKNLEWHLLNQIYYVNKSDYKREVIIDKGKEREILKLAYYPHRIVQWAIILQIGDILLKNLIYDTYASIPERGLHSAVEKIKDIMKNDEDGTKYCLKLDIKKYYPNIDNEILYKLFENKFKDKKLLNLLKIIIFSNGKVGQPIGSLFSQYASNFYLSKLDHILKEKYKIKYYFRYCDDMVIFHNNKRFLRELRKEIELFLNQELNLKLKENWQVFPSDVRGVDFLGYRFFKGYTLLRKRTLKSMKNKIKKIRKKEVLSFSDNCSINSYLGWLKYCNSSRLKSKYFKNFTGKKYRDQDNELRTIDLNIRF